MAENEMSLSSLVVPLLLLPLYTTQNERVWVAVACVCWFVPPVFVVVCCCCSLAFAYVGREDRRERSRELDKNRNCRH
jgi:hypothetical protein